VLCGQSLLSVIALLCGVQWWWRGKDNNELASTSSQWECYRRITPVSAIICGTATRWQQLGRHRVQHGCRVRVRVDISTDHRRPAQSVHTKGILLRSCTYWVLFYYHLLLPLCSTNVRRHLQDYLLLFILLIRIFSGEHCRGYLNGARCKWFAMVQLMPLPPHRLLLH